MAAEASSSSLRQLFGNAVVGPFGAHLQDGPGFALTVRGPAAAGAADLAARLRLTADSGWQPTAGPLRGDAVRWRTLVDPATGLAIDVTYLRHTTPSGACAISWRGWIEHRGDRPIERLGGITMLDVTIHLVEAAAGNPTVRSMRGGLNDAFFPPEAFAVSERTLFHSYRVASVRLDSGGTGRSTDNHVPYVVIASGQDDGGCFAALGWSALWRLSISRRGDRLWLEGAVEGVDLTLNPGERIPLPETLLGFYTGHLDDGANALRHVLRRDVQPLLGRKPVAPPVSYNHWFAFRLHVHEDDLRAQIVPCASLGVEYFIVDAGWFGGSETSYRAGCGNWGREAKHRFPSGVRALADEVRHHGMRFGIWMDPELIHPDSDTGRAHPEWLLRAEGSLDGAAVIDFSQQAARDWAVDTITDVVERYEVGWLRWDVNMPIAPNWAANDPPGRAGWHQLQHVAGVHEVQDRLLDRFPDLLLEGCCGGGRRMDLGLLRRSHTFWASDMTGPAPIVRAHQSGGNRLLPAGCFNTNLLYGPAIPGEPAAFPAAAWLSHFGGPLGFSADFRSWTSSQLDAGRAYVEAFKHWRHVLAGDFYPLFLLPRSLAEWDGWQFDDPESGEGLLVAFRGASPQATASLPLRGAPLGMDMEYAALVPAGSPLPVPAADRRTATVELDPGGAAAWTYRTSTTRSQHDPFAASSISDRGSA
jgi:hypothetical protein